MEKYFLEQRRRTKTTVRVADSRGKIVAEVVGGSINYYSEGLSRARENMAAILTELKSLSLRLKFTPPLSVCLLCIRGLPKRSVDFSQVL